MAHYPSRSLPTPPHTHDYGQGTAFAITTTTTTEPYIQTPATTTTATALNPSYITSHYNQSTSTGHGHSYPTTEGYEEQQPQQQLPSGASWQYGSRDLNNYQQHVTLGGALAHPPLPNPPTTTASFSNQPSTSAPFLPLPSASLSFARGNPPPHIFNPQAAAAAAALAAGHHQLPHRYSGPSSAGSYNLPSELHSQEKAKREALARGFGTNSNYPQTPRNYSGETSAATTAEVVASVLDSRPSIPSLAYNQHPYINPQHPSLSPHPQQAYHYPYAMPGSTIPDSSQNGNPASPASSSNGAGGDGARKSPPRARLTEQEKKNNHIASEQKRRNAIRDGFDHLTELIPGCEGQGRSEGMVLNKSIDYIRDQLTERRKLIEKIEALGGVVPPELREI